MSKEVFFEFSHKGEGYFFNFDLIYKTKSKFQEIVVGESVNFNRVLFLDGVVQFSESDEFIYHESLVQPVVHLSKNPKKILILGGGDGLAAREFFKHNDVEKVVIVDIDSYVSETSKKYFSKITEGTFEDSRLELRSEDAFKYVENTKEKFQSISVMQVLLTEPKKRMTNGIIGLK